MSASEEVGNVMRRLEEKRQQYEEERREALEEGKSMKAANKDGHLGGIIDAQSILEDEFGGGG